MRKHTPKTGRAASEQAPFGAEESHGPARRAQPEGRGLHPVPSGTNAVGPAEANRNQCGEVLVARYSGGSEALGGTETLTSGATCKTDNPSTTAAARSADEVLRDHLREGKHGSVERDLPRNYAQDLVVLTPEQVVHGWDGMRMMAGKLREELPQAKFSYTATRVWGRFALLRWTAETETGIYVDDGVDSYVIESGRIVAQTIHYTVKHR